MESIVMRRVDEEHLDWPDELKGYGDRNCKRYIAILRGLDDTYGFKREFIERVRVGRRLYFPLKMFAPGIIYEFAGKCYSRRGNLTGKFVSYGMVERITPDAVVFKTIKEEDVVKVLSKAGKSGNPVLNIVLKSMKTILKAEKERLSKEIDSAKKDIAELAKEVEHLQELLDEANRRAEELRKTKVGKEKAIVESLFPEVKRVVEEIAEAFGSRRGNRYRTTASYDRWKFEFVYDKGKKVSYAKANLGYIYYGDELKVDAETLVRFAKILTEIIKKLQEEATKTSSAKMPSINVQKYVELKEKVLKDIETVSLGIAKSFGRKKGSDYIFEGSFDGHKIKIRAGGKRTKYVSIDGNYLISQYDDEPSLGYALKSRNLLISLAKSLRDEFD